MTSIKMSLQRIILFGILSIILLQIMPSQGELRYLDSSFFLPNYARSFPGVARLPAGDLLLPPKPGPTVKIVPEDSSARNEEETPAGFHLGSELESRSLSDFPGLSNFAPIFNQPVSMSDLVGFAAQARVYHQTRPQSVSLIERTSFSPSNPLAQDHLGDYSNPFFRPIYARPPAPPTRSTISKASKNKVDCSCPCKCVEASTTAAPPVILKALIFTSTKIKSTTEKPLSSTLRPLLTGAENDINEADNTAAPSVAALSVVENKKVSLEPFPVSVKLTTVPATTQKPISSIENLVVQAFNVTRQSADGESKYSNGIPANSLDENLAEIFENDEVLPGKTTEYTDGVTPQLQQITEAASTSTTTATWLATAETSTATQLPEVSTVGVSAQRVPKKMLENIPQSNPFKPLNLALGKGPNRRFNSLLDLSMRRGGRHQADSNS